MVILLTIAYAKDSTMSIESRISRLPILMRIRTVEHSSEFVFHPERIGKIADRRGNIGESGDRHPQSRPDLRSPVFLPAGFPIRRSPRKPPRWSTDDGRRI